MSNNIANGVLGYNGLVGLESILQKLQDAKQKKYQDKIDIIQKKVDTASLQKNELFKVNTLLSEIQDNTINNKSALNIVGNNNNLEASVAANASEGDYDVVINNVAQFQKVATQSYASPNIALNIAGNIDVRQPDGSIKSVNVTNTDSLITLASKFSAIGMSSSVAQQADGSYKLVLEQKTADTSFSFANTSNQLVLQELGFINAPAAQIYYSKDFNNTNTALGLSGKLYIQQGNNNYTIAIKAQDSLDAITNKLTSKGINANISGANGSYHIEINSQTNVSFNGTSANLLNGLGLSNNNANYETDQNAIITQGQMANVIINNVNYFFNTNAYSVNGLNLNFKSNSSGNHINISVKANNIDANKVQSFVAKYNDLLQTLRTALSYPDGLLRGSNELRQIESELMKTSSFTQNQISIKDLGMEAIFDRNDFASVKNGTIKINPDKLQAAIDNGNVAKFFNNRMDVSDNRLVFLGADNIERITNGNLQVAIQTANGKISNVNINNGTATFKDNVITITSGPSKGLQFRYDGNVNSNINVNYELGGLYSLNNFVEKAQNSLIKNAINNTTRSITNNQSSIITAQKEMASQIEKLQKQVEQNVPIISQVEMTKQFLEMMIKPK